MVLPTALVVSAPLASLDAWIQSHAGAYGPAVDDAMRLLVAAIAGGLVGLERELRGRQAGLRTNLLVCVGSAIVMLVSSAVSGRDWHHASGVNVTSDPARIAYGVMAGVGFLGAGTIVKNDSQVHGLTTAAAMWCVAAVGLGAGLGMYRLTLTATALLLVVLWLLSYVERALPRTRFAIVTIRREWSIDCVNDTVRQFRGAGFAPTDVHFERSDDLRAIDIHLRLEYVRRKELYDVAKDLEAKGELLVIASRTT